jgi:murein DD-endopeptidase MepM/ murein hydrolase activator NlpD
LKYRLLLIAVLMGFSLISTAQEVTPTPAPPLGVTIHVVQRGESLWKIAQAYGVSIDEIATLNSIINTSSLQVGQRLLVPSDIVPVTSPSDSTAITIPQPSATLYTVASGDTLFRIAQRFGLTLNELAQANNIFDPSLIYAGQQLIIPSLASEATPTLTLPTPLTNIVLNPTLFVEGQTGSIRITTNAPITLTGTFLGQTLNVIALNSTTYAMMVGIPNFTEPNTYPINLVITQANNASSNFSFNISVVAGGYLTTDIVLSPEQEALLAPSVEEFEISTLQRITGAFTPEKYYVGTLGLPAAAPMNAPYGTRRSYNGGAVSRYHNGADFAAPPNTPIYAPADGRVVLADLLNIRGNTIVLDHGWGLYTIYAHLTTINVSLGERVQATQVIGTSGSTGRVTGPHLHWEVWLNGIPVDPMQWTQTAFP